MPSTNTVQGIDFDQLATSVPLRDGDQAWSGEELREVYDALTAESARLREDLQRDAQALSDFMAERDTSGEDQADTGSATLEREQELALNQNLQDMVRQCDEALRRIEIGRFGHCDSCGKAIGKARMQAYPRATLCVACKQREERRG